MSKSISNHSWWDKISGATQNAIEKKALYSIPTKSQVIEQNGIPFIVRIVDNLARKERNLKKMKKIQKKTPNFNPFLPFEQELFVGDISESHIAILNKFNVVDHHLLIITREFESQNNLLNLNDFTALWTILAEVEGLSFYNGGKIAGASQPHKHLQLVPYPLATQIDKCPLDKIILNRRPEAGTITLSELPFTHRIIFFPHDQGKNISELANLTLDFYYQLLSQVNIQVNQGIPSLNYNLLITREWMMVIPRTRESLDSIGINSLGFAGTLLVKNQRDLNKILQLQPLTILSQVAIEKS